MLSSASSVTTLNADRKFQIADQMKLAMGAAEDKFANSGALIWNVVTTMLCSCGPKPYIENFELDAKKIDLEKKRALEESSPSEKVSFVSTNDVLCSTIARAFRSRAFLMPINFRGRLPDFKDDDAGNYEGALVFGPEDYASPKLIRGTLQSGPPAFKRATETPLPGTWASMRCKLGMVTNWAFSFFQQMELEGADQLLHLPHCDVKMVPFDVCVVYRAKKGKLGVCFFTRSLGGREDILSNSIPVGNVVENAEKN